MIAKNGPTLSPYYEMAGIIHKIEETLHMGGKKEEHKGEAHKVEHHGEPHKVEHHGEAHKFGHGPGEAHKGENKEGFLEKVKDKIHGGEGGEHGHDGEKKKKEKKKKKDGHDHDGSSSSSDSD